MPAAQRSAGSMPVHHAEGYSRNSPERLDELPGTCLQGSTLFIILQQQPSRYAVDITRKTKYPTNQVLDKYPQLSWVGQICSCLPSVRETGVTSGGLSLPSCVSLLRVGYVQMNTYSVCMKEKKYPTSSESPGDSTDDEKEESPRLGLPSSSFTLDSSALMAHMDMAPHTKGRSNHVQTSAESPTETGKRREK